MNFIAVTRYCSRGSAGVREHIACFGPSISLKKNAFAEEAAMGFDFEVGAIDEKYTDPGIGALGFDFAADTMAEFPDFVRLHFLEFCGQTFAPY